MVVQGIMSMLNTDERFGNRKLAFTLCEHLSHIQANLSLLVLCFNISGIATDVTNTLKGIPQSENTAVLIFHHKDEHALPNQSSDRVLVNPEFKTFGGIFDMAFLAGKGIYSCEMNTNALDGIVKFLTNVQKVNDRT
ncbi:uncharacterized protein LOC128555220 [Mercenaria mercenaria]|uniref:uncharacterized protein LOC128555220 n=1 Tax=Mercenaria mercenaria TaxID=6596 RepID=UPI00234F72D3|nr:uncharacterized protein LOC128555220 [Mercenaria mercenaria]